MFKITFFVLNPFENVFLDTTIYIINGLEADM